MKDEPMTDLPSTGGSFVRLPDGQLIRETDEAPATPVRKARTLAASDTSKES